MQINDTYNIDTNITKERKIAPLKYIPTQMVSVGKFGKSVGLKGGIRITILTDFPEILCENACFYVACQHSLLALTHIFNITPSLLCEMPTNLPNIGMHKHCLSLHANNNSEETKQIYYLPLTLKHFNPANNAIQLQEITKREEADILRNMLFYSTIDDTRKLCHLKKDEFFYFDIIGMRVMEEGLEIGIVQDIQEIANTHYLVLDKNFLIPYIDRYVHAIHLQDRQIITQDARFLRIESTPK